MVSVHRELISLEQAKLSVSLFPMEHRLDMGAWRQNFGERLNKLKEDEKIKAGKAKAEQEKSRGAKEILDPQLCKAIRNKDMELFVSTLEKLCSEGLCMEEILEKTTRSGNTVLHLATDAGSSEIVELIADHFPRLDLTQKNIIEGETVLHVAARTRKSNLIETILHCYVRQCSPADTALQECFWLPKIQQFCKMKDKYGNTALHYAVMARDIDMVSSLFSADKQLVRLCNNRSKSPLYLAVECRELDIILLLLRDSIHASVEWDYEFRSPLHAAILGANNSDRDPFRIRKAIGDSFVSQNRRSLAREIKKSNAALVDLLLRERPNLLRSRDHHGSPLHWAASTGDVKCVEILLQHDPLSTLEWNKKGHLPVHVACKSGHVEVVKKMVEQEWLDPKDLRTRSGQNILHIAAENAQDKVVRYLLREKTLQQIFINGRDQDGNTPLHLAVKNCHPNVLLLLTNEKSLDFNLENHKGLAAREMYQLRDEEVPPPPRESLAVCIMMSADATSRKDVEQTEKRPFVQMPILDKWYKDQINTLMLVAILVATVTFAAGFTVPGGLNASDDPDLNRRGMSTLINRKMFQLYTICNTVAMYSSTFGSFIMLWGQLSDLYMTAKTWRLALSLVGSALITMSIAFMAAVHLVVSPLSWLANSVMIIAIIFLSVFLAGFTLLAFPWETSNPLLRPIQRLVFRSLIPFARTYRKVIEEKDEEKKESAKSNIKKDEEKKKSAGEKKNSAKSNIRKDEEKDESDESIIRKVEKKDEMLNVTLSEKVTSEWTNRKEESAESVIRKDEEKDMPTLLDC